MSPLVLFASDPSARVGRGAPPHLKGEVFFQAGTT